MQLSGPRHHARHHPDIVVRAPNHLGDLVLSLPALVRASPGAIVVRRPLAPLLELAGLSGHLVPLERGVAGMVAAAARLRTYRLRRGILLTPSLSSATLFVLAGLRERRGTRTDGRGLLLTEAVSVGALAGLHRSAAYMTLVTGTAPAEAPRPRLDVPEPLRAAWRDLVEAPPEQTVGVFPGSHASSRRWDPERFAELTRRLAARKWRVVVLGSEEERGLTSLVAGERALDLGGLTDLPMLVAGLAGCRLLVTNDSGPMHLAGAVGTPTVSLWGAGNPRETGPLGARHRMLRHADLPCVPCVRNRCPRHGKGTVLERAERECLELITVDEVEHAVMEELH